jgi:hypothetical protein
MAAAEELGLVPVHKAAAVGRTLAAQAEERKGQVSLFGESVCAAKEVADDLGLGAQTAAGREDECLTALVGAAEVVRWYSSL